MTVPPLDLPAAHRVQREILSKTPAAGEPVAALGDDLDSVRWLTGSGLESFRGARVVTAVQAIAERTGSTVGRQAAQEWLRRAENEEDA